MGVVIEREEWALMPIAYPLLSAAGLTAVLLLPYFSTARTLAHASGSSPSPFNVGAGPFLFIFSLLLARLRSPAFLEPP
jgi:hypothetical protein